MQFPGATMRWHVLGGQVGLACPPHRTPCRSGFFVIRKPWRSGNCRIWWNRTTAAILYVSSSPELKWGVILAMITGAHWALTGLGFLQSSNAEGIAGVLKEAKWDMEVLRTVEKQAFSGSTPDEYCSRACKAVVILSNGLWIQFKAVWCNEYKQSFWKYQGAIKGMIGWEISTFYMLSFCQRPGIVGLCGVAKYSQASQGRPRMEAKLPFNIDKQCIGDLWCRWF